MPSRPKTACPRCRRLRCICETLPPPKRQRTPRTPEQEKAHKARRGDNDWTERKRRINAVKAWRAQYGDWCPGWRRQSHQSDDLTADHIDPQDRNGLLQVLCRSCNARKGARR